MKSQVESDERRVGKQTDAPWVKNKISNLQKQKSTCKLPNERTSNLKYENENQSDFSSIILKVRKYNYFTDLKGEK